MESIGREMAEAEWVLRPGATHGADSAFERGCDRVGGDKRIDLPKAGFRGSRTDGAQVLVGGGARARALDRRHHPAWDGLDGYVKLLMARNTHQGAGARGRRTGSGGRMGSRWWTWRGADSSTRTLRRWCGGSWSGRADVPADAVA